MYFVNDMKDKSAIVCDITTTSSRFGYSGEDSPRHVFPSVVGTLGDLDSDQAMETEDYRLIFGDSIDYRRDGMQIREIVGANNSYNFDLVEEQMAYTFEYMHIDPANYPI
jgi:actin-related protein